MLSSRQNATERSTAPPARAGRLRAFAAAGLAAALSFQVLAAAGPGTRDRSAVRAAFAHALVEAGLGINEIRIGGHRVTLDADIFAALAVSADATVFDYDAAAARARLEQLPWVDQATVTARLPDRLEVAIVERAAYATWQDGATMHLVDRHGRRLSSIAPGKAPDGLLQLTGPGAAAALPDLDDMLASHADLRPRLIGAERVSGARWTLRFRGDQRVHLPATGARAALANFVILDRTGQIAGAHDIDLSDAGRTAQRRATKPAEHPAPALAATAPARRG